MKYPKLFINRWINITEESLRLVDGSGKPKRTAGIVLGVPLLELMPLWVHECSVSTVALSLKAETPRNIDSGGGIWGSCPSSLLTYYYLVQVSSSLWPAA